MADRGVIIFTVAACAAMIVILVLIVGIHVEPCFLVSQTSSISAGVSAFEAPEIAPVAPGAPARIEFDEPLQVRPYDGINRTTAWYFVMGNSSLSDVEYVCRLNYSVGFTAYLFGSPVTTATVPSSQRAWTLIDAHARPGMSGRMNAVHMPEQIRLTTAGENLPTYTS